MHRHLSGDMQIQTKESTQLSIPETCTQLLFAVLPHADTNKKRVYIQLHEFKQAAPDRHLRSHERGFQENYHVYHRIFIWKVKAEVCVKK
jgi:hypothetical protein